MYLREATNLGTTLLLSIPGRKQGTPDLDPFKETVTFLRHLITGFFPFVVLSVSSSDLEKCK